MNTSNQLSSIEIVDFVDEYQSYFDSLNREWIEKYFWVEPIDDEVLKKPQQYIIDAGGAILFIKIGNEIVGTAAIKKVDGSCFEFTKMAVDTKYRGHGLGKKLLSASLDKAQSMSAKKVILYSNRKLETAISLYRSSGFMEVPVSECLYARADIKMEYVF